MSQSSDDPGPTPLTTPLSNDTARVPVNPGYTASPPPIPPPPMHTSGLPPLQPLRQPARPSSTKRSLLLLGAGFGLLLVGCISGTAIGAGTNTTTASKARVDTTVTVTETKTQPGGSPAATVTVTRTATAAPAPPVAGTTIEDGTWTVGTDIAPGTYKVRDPITQTCYWGIYKAGTNQQNIINNGIETGGRPQVTLKVGQEFTTRDCGTWVKI